MKNKFVTCPECNGTRLYKWIRNGISTPLNDLSPKYFITTIKLNGNQKFLSNKHPLSHDMASGSYIIACNKIYISLVVYRFRNMA